jgi:hypothetical protein
MAAIAVRGIHSVTSPDKLQFAAQFHIQTKAFRLQVPQSSFESAAQTKCEITLVYCAAELPKVARLSERFYNLSIALK